MSGTEYLLDTNVVLGFLSGRDWARSFFEQAVKDEARFSVSSVTRMELLGFPGITGEEESALVDFLRELTVLRIDDAVEEEAIRMRRSRRLKLPDAIIAATAVVVGAILVTADREIGVLPGVRMLDPTLPPSSPP